MGAPHAVRWLAAALLAAGLAGASADPAPAAGGTVAGRWRLVEQSWGEGSTDLLRARPPLRVEFALGAEGPTGRVWLEGRERAAVPWPALDLSSGADVALRVRAIDLSPGLDRVLARYEAALPDEAGVVLEVTEDYRVVDGGSALAGVVTVRLVRDGVDSGGYVLRRRLERER